MNLDTQKMAEYAEFLESHSKEIRGLCDALGECLLMAVQCMDQQSGRAAALRMSQSIENIKKNVPISEDAGQRLILAKKLIEGAGQTFGGR